jgi:hypothetical protein
MPKQSCRYNDSKEWKWKKTVSVDLIDFKHRSFGNLIVCNNHHTTF